MSTEAALAFTFQKLAQRGAFQPLPDTYPTGDAYRISRPTLTEVRFKQSYMAELELMLQDHNHWTTDHAARMQAQIDEIRAWLQAHNFPVTG